MITIRDYYGAVVQRSQNLRGMLERSRKLAVDRIECSAPTSRGAAPWASRGLMAPRAWLTSRRMRSWSSGSKPGGKINGITNQPARSRIY